MPRNKVTVIGAGNVGATTAQRIAEAGLADVVLVDIVEGLPQGKGLDLAEAAPVVGHDARVTRHERLRGHGRLRHRGRDLGARPTAGDESRRPVDQERGDRPGGGRTGREGVARRDPHRGHEPARRDVPRGDGGIRLPARAGDRHGRRAGLRAVPDVHRAGARRVSVEDTHAFVLGGHGDTMVPLSRYCTVAGVPITELLPADRVRALEERTANGGAEIVALLKTGSAFYAPGRVRSRWSSRSCSTASACCRAR